MYFGALLPFLLFAQAVPVSLAFAPHQSLADASNRLHKSSERHVVDFVRDVRITLQELFVWTNDKKATIRARSPSGKECSLSRDASNSAPKGSGSAGGSPASGPTTSGNSTNGTYQLVASHAGSDFFDGFWFWSKKSDPTHGYVDFLGQSDAQAINITGVNDAGNAYIKVDTTQKITGKRKSIRITTFDTFTQGIFVLDAVHMPQGCGTWPSFWTNGPNWPNTGEIDIIEGVNDITNNQATIHTAQGCTILDNPKSLGIEAKLIGPNNCAAKETDDQGCAMRATSDTSYGSGFNSVGGGTYAMVWNNDEIAVYLFRRGAVPEDLTADRPDPKNNTWGTPMARWPSATCDISNLFRKHNIVIDTVLCGSWIDKTWNQTIGPGQDISCGVRTGYPTCEAFLQNNGSAFSEAYWEISSIKVYQTTREYQCYYGQFLTHTSEDDILSKDHVIDGL